MCKHRDLKYSEEYNKSTGIKTYKSFCPLCEYTTSITSSKFWWHINRAISEYQHASAKKNDAESRLRILWSNYLNSDEYRDDLKRGDELMMPNCIKN